MNPSITVSEIFGPTIAGEGPIAGLPTVFVRTGGCDSRCAWCDSMFAVDPRFKAEWTKMSDEEVMDKVIALSKGFPLLVSLSGGNPALAPLGELIARGHDNGYTFALETQGTVERDWFYLLDYLVVSPKGPSSGMRFERKRLERCVTAAGPQTEIALKFVVFGEEDYLFARAVAEDFGELPVYLQAGTPQQLVTVIKHRALGPSTTPMDLKPTGVDGLRAEIARGAVWLTERVVEDRWFDVRVGFQQHVIMWGDKRGV